MCGIAGIMGSVSKLNGALKLEKMLQHIEHRGPDSTGIWATDGVALGMRRLSIIDLAGGDQPIWTHSGIGIIFNGEIYNYKKIMVNLQNKGVVFKTQSDTEVIAQLYEKGGIAALQKLEGMFAVCIYDPNAGKVFLIRDRLGIKPLYYHQKEKKSFFPVRSRLSLLR